MILSIGKLLHIQNGCTGTPQFLKKGFDIFLIFDQRINQWSILTRQKLCQLVTMSSFIITMLLEITCNLEDGLDSKLNSQKID